VLLLFWNPDCGFCQRMLATLQAWDAVPPDDAPALIVVSAGSSARNREMGLSSPIVEDPQSQIGATFGARGTPMAVLLDAEGRVASSVAAGADAVMALANGTQRVRKIAAALTPGVSDRA
jgi:thiol-disulfide isomerase/thioredoxin